jgi:hypothetical protein
MNRYHNYTKEKILSFILDHKESCFEWNDLVMAFGWKRMSTEGHLLMALIRPSMSEMDRELLPERQMADNIKAFAWDNKLQVIIGREMITGRMEDIDKVFFLNKDFRELAEVVDAPPMHSLRGARADEIRVNNPFIGGSSPSLPDKQKR